VSGTYRIATEDAASLHWRRWDNEYVLYDAESGDTHLLDAVGRAVLTALGAGPLDFEALAARVAQDICVELDPDLIAHLRGLLRGLESAGLLARVRG
jgi:PqqD family protein of HPr-rel-A system